MGSLSDIFQSYGGRQPSPDELVIVNSMGGHQPSIVVGPVIPTNAFTFQGNALTFGGSFLTFGAP